MTSPSSGTSHDPPLDDGETYRLLPAEPKPAAAEPPVSPADEMWTPPDRDQPKKKKRKRRPAPTERPAATDAPDSEPTADAVPEWKPDTGWKEPPLVSALWFPFQGGGWKVVLLYSLLLFGAVILPLVGSVIGLIVLVFHSVLLLETANYTLEGIPSGPQFPDWLSWDAISAGLMGLVVFMIAGAPVITGLAIGLRFGGLPGTLQVGLVVVALFYLPMAFLALAEQQNEHALNPLLVFRGIRKLPVLYAALCGVAAVVFVAPQYILLLSGAPPAAQMGLFSCAWVYVSVALMRAVALVARKRELTFE